MVLDERTIHGQISVLFSESFFVGKNQRSGVGERHQLRSLQKERMRVQSVGSPEIVDAAWQTEGLFHVFHHVPDVGDSAELMCGDLHGFPFSEGILQIHENVAVQFHSAVGQVIHPRQSQPHRFRQIPPRSLLCLQFVTPIDIDRLNQLLFFQCARCGRAVIDLVAGHENEFCTDEFTSLCHSHRSLHIHPMRLFRMLFAEPSVAQCGAVQNEVGAMLREISLHRLFVTDVQFAVCGKQEVLVVFEEECQATPEETAASGDEDFLFHSMVSIHSMVST